MTETDNRERIWAGDRLGRRGEADTIERFVSREVENFKRLNRSQSIVLGIDAPYGMGKSWFLNRLADQLALSHPVARIDAWADDAGDEPFTAFMAAIDDALRPYIPASKKLRDHMTALRVSAFPVIGKIASGAIIKTAGRIAGDEIHEVVGNIYEDALRNTKESSITDTQINNNKQIVIEGSNRAFEKMEIEIENLVDRRGAAMLAAYKQRKQSRTNFRENMQKLLSIIEKKETVINVPLIVVIDELDRCRPTYAIKMLEEIKHFFEVPGIVFIIGLYENQLSKSVKVVYGSEFDSESYLRRFFTRRYELREASTVEMASDMFEEWEIDESKFMFPKFTLEDSYKISNSNKIGLILSEYFVTPREIFPIMDGLRLFVEGWEHPEPIEPIAVLSSLVQLVRGSPLNYTSQPIRNESTVSGTSWNSPSTGVPAPFQFNQFLSMIDYYASHSLLDIAVEKLDSSQARNYFLEILHQEIRSRSARSNLTTKDRSHLYDYIPRIRELGRFLNKKDNEEKLDRSF